MNSARTRGEHQLTNGSVGEIRYHGKIHKLESPQTFHGTDAQAFTYQWPDEPGLKVLLFIDYQSDGPKEWVRHIDITNSTKLDSDLTVSLDTFLPPFPAETWLPLHNGTGAILGTNQAAAFHFAGTLPGDGARLAIPMVSVPVESGQRMMIATDPYFSTLFRSNRIEWTYPMRAGLDNGFERRTIFVRRSENSVENSLNDFFDEFTEPYDKLAWLHEIALVDFDYLSDGGEGWFHDIDALTAKLSAAERRQVFLCVHGCYDFLGRYCFDDKTRKLDTEWTCFSNYEKARDAHPYGTIGGDRVEMGFTNCRPHAMSLKEVHRRLRYARSRGFRAGIYFADGMNAGDGLPDFTPDRVLRWGGWQGADSCGKSYIQNPLNPKVRDFFVHYAKAMLDEYGSDIDALVWDETFHIPCGQLGTESWPGYADRAMMNLMQEIRIMVDSYNLENHRQIALLASDDIGALSGVDAAPYALFTHGTYQDSWCQPKAWSYGIFPNYRNVMWSCCWWPVTKWEWVEFGVRNYQAPVSLSNGWGDDKGFSEMSPEQQARVLELFRWRKQKPTKLRWFEQLPKEPAAN